MSDMKDISCADMAYIRGTAHLIIAAIDAVVAQNLTHNTDELSVSPHHPLARLLSLCETEVGELAVSVLRYERFHF